MGLRVGDWFARLKGRRSGSRIPPPARAPIARPPFRRHYVVEALEPRVLLSADLPVVPPPPPPDPHVDAHPVDAAHAAAGGDHVPVDDHAAGADVPVLPADPQAAGAPAPGEIAFVDSRIVNSAPQA